MNIKTIGYDYYLHLFCTEFGIAYQYPDVCVCVREWKSSVEIAALIYIFHMCLFTLSQSELLEATEKMEERKRERTHKWQWHIRVLTSNQMVMYRYA